MVGTAGNVHDIVIRDNVIDSNSNGQPVVNLNAVNKFILFGNTYPNTKAVTLTGTTNRITPADD